MHNQSPDTLMGLQRPCLLQMQQHSSFIFLHCDEKGQQSITNTLVSGQLDPKISESKVPGNIRNVRKLLMRKWEKLYRESKRIENLRFEPNFWNKTIYTFRGVVSQLIQQILPLYLRALCRVCSIVFIPVHVFICVSFLNNDQNLRDYFSFHYILSICSISQVDYSRMI